MNYYNENDPLAVEWLKELLKQGVIAPGVIDDRSIEDVLPADLAGFRQCHFFAGIGGWSYALRLAQWADDLEVWTGSCPCQPFSAAGKRGGIDDERHLWPAWFHLVEQCRPRRIFGEQVASKDGLAWLDLVCSDLERSGYSVGAADICAAGVGAPHIRQRLYFVADSDRKPGGLSEHGLGHRSEASGSCQARELAHSDGWNAGKKWQQRGGQHGQQSENCFSSFWNRCDWIPFTDGKTRPVEPGTFPLANGVSGRVGLLRGYGNAIVAPLAACFVEAARECLEFREMSRV